ncbi:MAG: DUF1446 domain-containing protein [Desulfobacterales bacterium]|nr:DUF1446 domain-containing protein [Desulfobacterales bacterium]
MTIILTGLDIEKKARVLEDAFFDALGGREQFQQARVQLIRSDKEDPATNEEAFAYLRHHRHRRGSEKSEQGIVEGRGTCSCQYCRLYRYGSTR